MAKKFVVVRTVTTHGDGNDSVETIVCDGAFDSVLEAEGHASIKAEEVVANHIKRMTVDATKHRPDPLDRIMVQHSPSGEEHGRTLSSVIVRATGNMYSYRWTLFAFP